MTTPRCGIAANLPPTTHDVHEQQRETGESREHAAVVAEQPAHALGLRGLRDDALRKAQDDRETFVRRERRGQLPARNAGPAHACRIVRALRALRARVALGIHTLDGHGLGQTDLYAGALDCKVPARADRVPVELVVIGEKADLPRRAIAQRVAILRGQPRQKVVVAGVDSHAVLAPLREPRLGHTIALHTLHLETDDDVVPVAVAIARRKVAIDASADLVAFGADRDLLGDLDRAARVHVHFDHVLENALALLGDRGGRGRDQAKRDGRCSQRATHGSFTATPERCSVSAW